MQLLMRKLCSNFRET